MRRIMATQHKTYFEKNEKWRTLGISQEVTGTLNSTENRKINLERKRKQLII